MADDDGFRPPAWAKPAPLGYAQAADAAHFVAAPLLAGASAALIGVVTADADNFRLPSLALLALVLAVVALISSVQYGFQARAYLYSSADVEDWWGLDEADRHAEWLQSRQRSHYERWKAKIGRAVTMYNLGITLLGVGVTVCLLPESDPGDAPDPVRWVAVGISGVATLGELAWTVMSPRRVLGTGS